jgi:hypothetical protein
MNTLLETSTKQNETEPTARNYVKIFVTIPKFGGS